MANQNLTLHDENLNIIKTIEKINGEDISPFGIAMNDNYQLYISNFNQHKIFKTDLNFNKIKSFGSVGNNNNQFRNPYDICYKNSHLYVCDYGNKRIQILTENLEFEKSFSVNYAPWVVKASNSLLCVESGNPVGIYFYSLHDLSLQQKYDHGFCRITEIDSCFYECSTKSKTVFCYDENGCLIEEIKFNVNDRFACHNYDGAFLNFGGNLLMTWFGAKNFIRFNK
jgi:hypothetical protein